MRGSNRRINKLRLSSPSEQSLAGDIAALQDAFRIASLPGIPPQGLLLIKRLDLGTFPARSSALALSRLVDDRFRNSAPTAICADHGDFADQPLVWFSDPAAAALGLAELVAANRHPRAWYWQTLFPDWRRGMSLAATLTAIAAGVPAPLPAAAVLREVTALLVESLPVARLVDAIEPRLAQSLLREAGVYREPASLAPASPAPHVAVAGPGTLPPAWRRTVGHALARRDRNDPRCRWLGYCALTAANPALALDPRLAARVDALLGDIAAAPDADPAPVAARAHRGPEPADASSASGERGGPAPGPTGRSGRNEAAPSSGVPARAPRDRPAAPASPAPASPPRDRPAAPAATLAAPHRPSIPRAGAAAPAAREAGVDRDGNRRVDGPRISPLGDHRPPPAETVPANAAGESPSFDGLVHSEQAGLVLVIRLLELLGIERLLERHPALAAINLPAVIATAIARRLRVPPDHPLLLALPQLPPVETRLDAFECPATWRELIAAPGGKPAPLHHFDTTPSGSHCYLTDRSRRLLLYAGAGNPARWTRRHRITRHGGVHPRPTAHTLVPGVQLLICRYLRRYGDISLRRLVRRPGRLAATRTHLDVLFDLEQADIRIRKAGLDIDPGWVAWLGRVVRFHYLEGESGDV